MHTIKPAHSVLEGKQAPEQRTSQQVVVPSDPLPYAEDPSVALANTKRKVVNSKIYNEISNFMCLYGDGEGRTIIFHDSK